MGNPRPTSRASSTGKRFWRTPEGPSSNGTFCKIPNPRRKRIPRKRRRRTRKAKRARMARTKMAKIRTKRMTKKTKRRRKRMKRKSRKANHRKMQSKFIINSKPNRLVILLLSTFYFQFFRSLILYTISVSTIEPLEGASIFHHSEALFENWLVKITDIDVKLFMMYQ